MKKNKPILIILSILVAGALVLFINGKFNNDSNISAPKTSTPTATAKPTNMIEYQNPNGPTVKEGEVSINTVNNIVSTTSGRTLTIDGAEIKSTSDKCTIKQPSEFCMVASGKINNTKFDIYFLKDALHSRLFESPVNFTKLNILGSPSSGTMEMQFNGENKYTIVVTNNDASGWLIIPENNSSDNNNLTGGIKIN